MAKAVTGPTLCGLTTDALKTQSMTIAELPRWSGCSRGSLALSGNRSASLALSSRRSRRCNASIASAGICTQDGHMGRAD